MAASDQIGRSGVRRHSHNGSAEASEARCPYCGSKIAQSAFEQIRARIENEERERLSREREEVKARTRAEVEKVKKEAAAAVAAQIRAIRDSQETTITQRVQAVRDASDRKLTQAINSERAKAYAEKLRLTEQLGEMQRRLEKRTPAELGEEGELDLFTTIRSEFATDQVTRIGRGVAGGDIVHAVVTGGGEIAGTILIDSKNVSRFSRRYIGKLREDQLRAEADFAILAITAPLPNGERHLAVMDGVIVAHPARIIAVLHLLRRLLFQMHRMRLGNAGRLEKAEALYRFVASPAGSDLLDRIVGLTHDISDLDLKETKSHQQVWRRRAELIVAIQDAKTQFSDTVVGIITSVGDPSSPEPG